MYISEGILITIEVALKQHWEDSIRSQLMQDAPDELPSNADTVSWDHDIAKNIPIHVLVLVSLLQTWLVIRTWIISMPKSAEKQCAICSTHHKSNTRFFNLIWKCTIKTVKVLCFIYLSTCHTYGLLDAILEKKKKRNLKVKACWFSYKLNSINHALLSYTRLYLETHCRVSNNRGVAKAGSLCMKVARTITQ